MLHSTILLAAAVTLLGVEAGVELVVHVADELEILLVVDGEEPQQSRGSGRAGGGRGRRSV